MCKHTHTHIHTTSWLPALCGVSVTPVSMTRSFLKSHKGVIDFPNKARVLKLPLAVCRAQVKTVTYEEKGKKRNTRKLKSSVLCNSHETNTQMSRRGGEGGGGGGGGGLCLLARKYKYSCTHRIMNLLGIMEFKIVFKTTAAATESKL